MLAALVLGRSASKEIDTAAFVNLRAKRTIDASKQIVLVKTDLSLSVVKPGSKYIVAVPNEDVPHLSTMQVSYSDNTQAKISQLEEYTTYVSNCLLFFRLRCDFPPLLRRDNEEDKLFYLYLHIPFPFSEMSSRIMCMIYKHPLATKSIS